VWIFHIIGGFKSDVNNKGDTIMRATIKAGKGKPSDKSPVVKKPAKTTGKGK